jgi:two-component system response regulator RegX3
VSARVLIVEDEPAIADAVAYSLQSEGYTVDVVHDGEAGLARAREGGLDVAILDLMLPRLSGIEVCRRLRAEGDLPIILLTARDAEVDRVIGLEAGADDYVTKPFSMPELLSRVRALLRRRELDRGGDAAIRVVGDLRLDLVRHEASVDGRPLRLTPSELRLLALLAAEPDRVFSRREIMQHLWGSEHVGDERATDVHVANLRRKLERDPARPVRLLTVRGAGYKLGAGVSEP